MVAYFYYIKFFKLYSIYHKPNGGINVFKMKHFFKKLIYLVFMSITITFPMRVHVNIFFSLIYYIFTHEWICKFIFNLGSKWNESPIIRTTKKNPPVVIMFSTWFIWLIEVENDKYNCKMFLTILNFFCN